jgi:ABC-type multidrug transport system fused ATPase/permease subunit
MIQKAIKLEFKDRTTLVIAHRIDTIMDMDKILYLDRGEVHMFGSPAELLQNEEFKAKIIGSFEEE